MLKSFTPFEIITEGTYIALNDNLDRVLSTPTARDPANSEWSAAGFTLPIKGAGSAVFMASDLTLALNVQVRERVLPSKVIKEAVKAAADDAERRQGYKPGRKELAEIKDNVVASLLPSSHVRPTDIPIMLIGDYLLIGTTSANKVDLVIDLLNDLYPDAPERLALRPLGVGRRVGAFMGDLLLGESTESGKFNVGTSVVLKGNAGQTARYKGVDLASESVTDSVATGMRPVELDAWFKRSPDQDASVSFSITDNLLIKRVKFADILINEVTDTTGEDDHAVTEFDATVAILGGELKSLLDSLLDEIATVQPDEPDTAGDDEL